MPDYNKNYGHPLNFNFVYDFIKSRCLKTLVTLLFAVMPLMVWATIATSAGSGSMCPGMEVAIPITVSNCNGVSAISLALNYDANKVTYLGYQNASSHFGGNLYVNATGGTVYLTWFSLNAINFGNETLIEFRFEGIAGSSALTWYTNYCEYSDSFGNVIPSNYTNGSATVYGPPAIFLQPSDLTLMEGENALFSVRVLGSSMNYQWQVSTNGGATWSDLSNNTPYNNVTTQQMSITSIPSNFNGNRYRCRVTGACGLETYSHAVLLTVGMVHTSHLSTGWNWWSTYVEQEGINGLQMLENSLGTSGIRIQGKNASVDYYAFQGQTIWYGNLNAINNEQMFKIRTSAACDAVISGNLALPENHPIIITEGWNWIGFPGTQSLSLETALNGFTPEPNDVIKGRSQSATYYSFGSNSMWYGNLNNLEPGQGYMYKSNSPTPKTLVFPSSSGN